MTLSDIWRTLAARAREWRALARSIKIYHLDRAHHRAMDRLYSQFIKPGDLVFDIGAHVGDRISSFRRCGAKVVALEPQPGPLRVIGFLHGRDRDVQILASAAGAETGMLTLSINSANPTVSTASDAFVSAAQNAKGWEGQVWDHQIEVPVTTLDALISQYGLPKFIKSDVEGFEHAVLMGLSRAVPVLSFEFTTIARDVAQDCLDRVVILGYSHFNVALGESQKMVFSRPVDLARMSAWLATIPHEANSGDVYAFVSP